MLLASDALTAHERALAYAEVPSMRRARDLMGLAFNFVTRGAADLLDQALGPNYAREGLVALMDGADLLRRAAGELAESKAVELYSSRREPNGYLDVSDLVLDGAAKANLRRHLTEMPIQNAAVRIDGALNHLASAVVRLAFESNMLHAREAKMLGLDHTLLPTRRWKSAGEIVDGIPRLDRRGVATAFPLFANLTRCWTDADVTFARNYRSRLIHREVPKEGWSDAPGRDPSDVFHYPPKSVLDSESSVLPAIRTQVAAALSAAVELGEAIAEFVPRWARVAGLSIEVQLPVTVILKAEFDPVGAPRVVDMRRESARRVQVKVQGQMRSKAIPRARRDPGSLLTP